jgi:hypothetical protein
MNAENQMKPTPTEELARNKPDFLRPIIKIKPVSAAVPKKDRTNAWVINVSKNMGIEIALPN